MDRLKKVIEQYGRWTELTAYTHRIETYLDSDFSIAAENAKALLEAIGKEICKIKDVALDSTVSINAVLKKAFTAIGYPANDLVTQISSALATIGQKMGELRTEIGATSHGMSLEELKIRNDKVDGMTREFLIDATVIVACFLIRSFENENPRTVPQEEAKILYTGSEEFNDSWDDTYGEFEMGIYSYPASEILYNVDYEAYVTEQKTFAESEQVTNE
jgi:hypothetical protein